MIATKAFSPSASWTYKLDSEQLEDHDFSNLLQEFAYAVQRQDRRMMEYCECELKRMFRERKAATRRPSNALVKHDRLEASGPVRRGRPPKEIRTPENPDIERKTGTNG